MKSLKYTWLLRLPFLSAGFISCKEYDEYFDDKYQDVKIVIDQFYLEDYEFSVPDRPVTLARLS